MRSAVWSTRGMVATSLPQASLLGLDILRDGGNAVDAALGALAMLWLGEPTGCGLGGDLFALVWDPGEKRLIGLNASGRSAKRQTLEALRKKGSRIEPRGHDAISVPGCLEGWYTLQKRFGHKRPSQLLRPVIRAAEEGIPLSPVIARGWAASEPLLRQSREATETFLPWGRAPKPGDIFANPRLAQTLRTIIAGGPDEFYRGRLTGAILSAMNGTDGVFGLDDLGGHHTEWVAPISTDYRGYRVWQIPPNSQGLAVLQMLNLLEGYDLAALTHGGAEYWHLMAEAKKIAYADRARHYADRTLAWRPLLEKAYADKRRGEIDLAKAGEYAPGDLDLRHTDTVYLCAADSQGWAVSLIQSNYMGFGSGVMADGLGFMFQNRGCQFALDESHANRFEGGKRPFHTIIPGFVTHNGHPWMTFGVMGGDMQPQGQVQVLTNIVDYGMDPQEAGDAPRMEHVGSATPEGALAQGVGTLVPEPGIPLEVLADLETRGHHVAEPRVNGSGYQAIRIHPHAFEGATETRKDGMALGW